MKSTSYIQEWLPLVTSLSDWLVGNGWQGYRCVYRDQEYQYILRANTCVIKQEYLPDIL